MKIFELKCDIHFRAVSYDAEMGELLENKRGKLIGAEWPKITLQSRKGEVKKGVGFGDCPYFAPEMLIVSDKLRDVIQSFKNLEVEFLPVEIDGQKGFSCMNVLRVLDALDVDRSEVKRFEDGAIMYVVSAQFRAEIVSGHNLFLLSNYRGVYVSEDLLHAMEQAGIVGVTFRDPGRRVENPFEEVFVKSKKDRPKRGPLH